jgi:PAS domain-containing protein
MTRDAEPILTLFEALMRAETLEAAVQGAARHISVATESVTTGVVIVIHGGVFLEAWHPDEQSRSRDPFLAVRRMVIHAAQNGTAAYMPIDDFRGPMVARVIHLTLRQRLSGAVCVISPPEAASPDGAEGDSLERLAGLVALRLNGLLELESERRKSQQFERWFRVSDRQIRALDLERQKFAALVSSFAGGAFVADRDGVISWQSRPLFGRAAGSSNSWVGRGCREFCETLGGAGHPACGDCLVARVLARRQPTSCDIAFTEHGEERTVRASGAPINDLAGRAQEVMVTFQDVVPSNDRPAEEAA